jgi:tetrahydromethanopterin S-methyltransferase subunit F
MKQIETELLKNSDYEERIIELEKLNAELNYNLNETKAVVNDIKYKQLNSLDGLM